MKHDPFDLTYTLVLTIAGVDASGAPGYFSTALAPRCTLKRIGPKETFEAVEVLRFLLAGQMASIAAGQDPAVLLACLSVVDDALKTYADSEELRELTGISAVFVPHGAPPPFFIGVPAELIPVFAQRLRHHRGECNCCTHGDAPVVPAIFRDAVERALQSLDHGE